MYCRNCGQEISINAVACPKCGANPHTEKNFCSNCGVTTNTTQVMCVQCGASLALPAKASSEEDNSKTVSILAHITFIGTFVALIMNNQKKTEFGSFYVRQTLGLLILNLIGFFTVEIFFIGLIILVFDFVVWIISLVNAINNKTTPIPVYGNMFQKWFKGL